jgi:hypothetical protein
MACSGGCGGSRYVAGTTPAQPLIFGADDASLPVRHVIVVQASAGVPSGAPRWVRGTDVDTKLINGELRLLEN